MRSTEVYINIQTIKVSALQTVYIASMRQDRRIGKNNCSPLKLFFSIFLPVAPLITVELTAN